MWVQFHSMSTCLRRRDSVLRKSKLGRFVAVVSILVVLMATPLAVTLARRGAQHSEGAGGVASGGGGNAPALSGDAPFPGTSVSLDEAKGALSYAVFLPEVSQANDQVVSSVWLQEQSQKLGVVYGDTDISLVIEPTDFSDGGAARFERYVRSGIAKSDVQLINGHQVLSVYPGTDTLGTNPSYVELVLDGLDISMFSKSEDPQVLLGAMKSLLIRQRSSLKVRHPRPRIQTLQPFTAALRHRV
jgi:hypothetical protein